MSPLKWFDRLTTSGQGCIAAALAALLLVAAVACGHRMVEPDATPEPAGPPCGEHAAVERSPVPEGVYAYPAEALDPPWLDGRRSDQIADADRLNVFCDFRFVDLVEESGITFRHRPVDDAARTYKAVHYDHGNGLAVADVDGDGLHDIYFVNQIGANQLWRNLGSGRFEDVTAAAGVAVDDRVSVSASFADIENDGDPDLYVTTVRSGNLLFENDGAGRFRDVTAASGTGYAGHSSGAVFFDYDADGLLDLYVTNVGRYTSERLRPMAAGAAAEYESGSYEFYDGLVDAFDGHLYPDRSESSVLYRNLGGGRFADVTEKAGLADAAWSGDATPLDVNGDGLPDLYVLNMQGHDLLYLNTGSGFVLNSEAFPRTPWGAMGVKAFDYDNDGDVDLFVTDMHSDMSEDIGPQREKAKSSIKWPEAFLMSGGRSIYGNAFYENRGDGTYSEVSDALGAETYWPWGLSAADLNADGYQDAFVTGSMSFPFRYAVNSVLLNNRGEGFADSEFILGVEPRREWRTAAPAFEIDCAGEDRSHRLCAEGDLTGRVEVWGAIGSRSSAVFDLDGDGDLDIVTSDFNAPPQLLVSNLSDSLGSLSYIKIVLEGTESNRDGLGATVTVSAGGSAYTQVHDGKSGYLSQSRLPLYFGLGDAQSVESIEVEWPSGRRQTVDGPLDVNAVIHVREG
ncbi:MAG: CRTAC1 family protein [Chloroflexota bacterium]|nr:CRTAC1 family protein [Chloroflexota bacterium]MDE2941695.1 CRTAC1 family protein [Chloroflexota bacterium]MDE3267146.1 CRTAC1 family protein [Chloroflexota bacterium]